MQGKKRTVLLEDHAGEGLEFCAGAVSNEAPRYMESTVAAPFRTIGAGSASSLKASFWRSTVEEANQVGDPGFVSVALNTGGGRVWRNSERVPTGVGAVAMQPFEGARWRFELPVTFTHLYVPFKLLSDVTECLFDRELRHSELLMPAGIRDERLCGAAHSVHMSLLTVEPTNLVLDSMGLILAETLVRRISLHADRRSRVAFGKIPARRVAHVVDYVEANLDRDLSLGALAQAAAMSPFHFARSFKKMTGVSPHNYVLTRRVRHAQALLKTTQQGIADVAASCGFSNQAHLTNTFKSLLGVTPGAYRRSVQSR